MIGKRFSKLKVLSQTSSYKWKNTSRKRWLCVCDCGETVIKTTQQLKTGKTQQCKACAYANRPQSTRRLSAIERLFKLHILDRAKKKNISANITLDDYKHICKQSCYYCGEPPKLESVYKNKYSKTEYEYRQGVDRIDPNKGYTLDNVLPCCKFCNIAKSDLTLEQFIIKIKQVYRFIKKEREHLWKN